MKNLALLSVLFFITLHISSQNLITYSQKKTQVGFNIQGNLWGYKTHFSQADSSKFTFISNIDTVEFWVYSQNNEEVISIYTNNQFTSEGNYDLYVENSIDSVMYLQNAVSVSSLKYVAGLDVTSNWRFNADTAVNIQIRSYSLDYYPNTAYSAYFYIPNQDTIFVDSVEVIGSQELTLYFNIDSNSTAGYFDLNVYKSLDSLNVGNNAIYISNDRSIQIDSLTPDSMNNLKMAPIELIIYGNHTHFTIDSNKLFPIWWTEFDSTIVVNDSLLKAYISFPLPVKQAVLTNTIFSLYNPTDGLLEYPIRFDMYGAVESKKPDFGDIKCYPNPANDFIYISSMDFIGSNETSITVYSAIGSKVGDVKISRSSPETFRINVQGFSSGFYLLYINDSERQQLIKFIKL